MKYKLKYNNTLIGKHFFLNIFKIKLFILLNTLS